MFRQSRNVEGAGRREKAAPLEHRRLRVPSRLTAGTDANRPERETASSHHLEPHRMNEEAAPDLVKQPEEISQDRPARMDSDERRSFLSPAAGHTLRPRAALGAAEDRDVACAGLSTIH